MASGRFATGLLVAGSLLATGVTAPLPAQTLAEGRAAYLAGQYDDAITSLSKLVRRQPASAEAARALVAALSEVGRYADAERAARRFMDANPGSPELWNALGEVLAQTGKLSEARDAFDRAVTGGASNRLRARLNRAVLRHDAGERAEALREFDAFIDVYNQSDALTSDDLSAVATAVRYLGARSFQLYRDALRAYDEAIGKDPDNLEPRVSVGELFLYKYVGTEARASFQGVLERNPKHPRALLGLGQTARFEGSPRAMEQVRASLEVNQNFVPARVFLARLLIEQEAYGPADQEIHRALDVNPASLDALAVRAAIRFLQGDDRGFDVAVRNALALNPIHADLYNTLADVSAKNRRYHEAVDFARQAIQLDSTSWRGFSLMGMNQLRTGAVSEGRAALETAFAGDPYDVWTKNTLDLLDTLVQYPTTGTERFTFHIDGKESELLTLYLGPLAEEAYDRLAAKYGYRPPTPIRVELFSNHADFSVRTLGLVGLGALGVSFGPVVAMDSPSARKRGEFNWGTTLWHELAHTFHLAMSGGRVPRWFTEGLAVYEERRARPGWGMDVMPAFLDAFHKGRLAPVSDLNRGFMRPEFPEQIGFSYFQASLVCELIERDYGAGALVEMLAAFRRGQTAAEAFRVVLGTEPDAFDRHFDAYVKQRFAGQYASLRDVADTAQLDRADVERRALRDTSDFLAQLAMGHLLFESGSRDDAVRYLERAKALFPEYAGHDSPYWYLAQIHKQNRDHRRAAAELMMLTHINEQHYQGHLELADMLLMIDDSSGAAAALERAMFIYPYEFDVHARLAGLYRAIGRFREAVRERQAVLALDPVDRADALYELARAYLEADDAGMARTTVLRALEAAPNFEKAQQLLLQLHSTRSR